jgi:alpha-L-arabinofuranosidase
MSPSFAKRHRRNLHRKFTGQWVELLEQRRLLSVVTVNALQTVRSVDTDLLGVNLATWDGLIATGGSSTINSQTQQLVAAAGLQAFRIPGGSTADTFHFATNSSSQGASVAAMAELVASVNGVGVATVNYGTGSPQEGAAMLAYLNAPINDPAVDNVVIGDGEQWNGSTWVQVNWQTAGYWASLRAATPLATDDGLNFLRIGRAAPFGFHYWEMGNEEYGSWETDEHGASGDTLPMPAGATPKPHDPTTYISFSKQFAALAAQIDPTISIGLSDQDPGNDSGFVDPTWTSDILAQCVAQGFIPGFISDHMYPQGPGSESDATLLGVADTTVNSTNPYDLAQRAADYRADLTKYFGAAASNIELLGTEYNSVYTSPGKQSTSIINAMFIDDSIGAMMDTGPTGYDGLWVWDLHNGDGDGDNLASLYGWRTYGDYGILANGGSYGKNAKGGATNEPFPDYYAEQIASKIVQSGGTVVQTSTTSSALDAFSVLEPNGDLDVMVINKTAPGGSAPPNNLPDPGLLETLQIQGFTPSGQGSIWQYGVTQDDAQDTSGSTSLADTAAAFTVSNGSFSYTFPDYSVTVMDLKPAPTLSVSQAAAANPNPVTGVSTDLSAAATENGSGTGLIYTWSAAGPAAVLFSANGTNAASSDTATFAQAGSYNFTVTITDPYGQQTTSSVGVNVQQTPTAIAVSPSAPTLAISSGEQFSATATDQFGIAIASPAFNWSVTGSANSISPAGLLALGATPGTYTVTAAIGTVQGMATVTALAAPTVSDFIVNDGNVQRSMVDSVTVDFSEPVTLATGAITLDQRSPTGGAPTPESFTLSNPSGDQETYVLTFTGSQYVGNSLPDGVYDLVVQAALVTNAADSTLSGGDQTFSFYRLFGDFNGTGVVDLSSLVVIASNYGATSSSAGWLWYADYNADGEIDLTELVVIASDFGNSLSTSDFASAAVIVPAAAPMSSTQDVPAAASISAPVSAPAVTAISDPPTPTPTTAPPACEDAVAPTPLFSTVVLNSSPVQTPAAKVGIATAEVVTPANKTPIANHPTFGGWGSSMPADNNGDLATLIDSADPTNLRSA